jgi:hypothetical protein
VLRVTSTARVKHFKPTYDFPACKKCGYRPYYGVVETLSQIDLPKQDNTFFTPKYERPQGQDVFLTEKVALILKTNRARGRNSTGCSPTRSSSGGKRARRSRGGG